MSEQGQNAEGLSTTAQSVPFRRRRRGGSIASSTGSHSQPGNDGHDDNEEEEDDNQWELLMRHSSPLMTANRMTSPLTERNSSPSPMGLTRPRSNPRNRTPMRYNQSPIHGGGADGFVQIPEEPTHNHVATSAEGTRIRPLTAGRPVGTTLRGTQHQYAREGGSSRPQPVVIKSRKQGPSHRKIRRWNNSNFVNLAAEVGSGKAGQALLQGQAEAAQYQQITDPSEHTSKAMERLWKEEGLQSLREGFFAGDVHAKPAPTPVSRKKETPANQHYYTPDEMLLRIEGRLRKVVIKACENSFPASQVIHKLETFVKAAHRGKSTNPAKLNLEETWWKDLLLEPPSVTHRKKDDAWITRFLFDGEMANAGFHRLLLHGLCQFHGLRAISNSMEVTLGTGNDQRVVQARLLTAVGQISEDYKNVKLVDSVTTTRGRDTSSSAKSTEKKLQEVSPSQLSAVQVS